MELHGILATHGSAAGIGSLLVIFVLGFTGAPLLLWTLTAAALMFGFGASGPIWIAFAALALSGFAVVFGLQSVINLGVNVSLLPAKGMTLPFISYGGSSLIGMALAMGLVLALGRRRPSQAGSAAALHPALA